MRCCTSVGVDTAVSVAPSAEALGSAAATVGQCADHDHALPFAHSAPAREVHGLFEDEQNLLVTVHGTPDEPDGVLCRASCWDVLTGGGAAMVV
jgi:hypothetical protein